MFGANLILSVLYVRHVSQWHEFALTAAHHKAVDTIANANLKRLMTANLDRISFNLGDISKKNEIFCKTGHGKRKPKLPSGP
jgi:hypothetical protein